MGSNIKFNSVDITPVLIRMVSKTRFLRFFFLLIMSPVMLIWGVIGFFDPDVRLMTYTWRIQYLSSGKRLHRCLEIGQKALKFIEDKRDQITIADINLVIIIYHVLSCADRLQNEVIMSEIDKTYGDALLLLNPDIEKPVKNYLTFIHSRLADHVFPEDVHRSILYLNKAIELDNDFSWAYFYRGFAYYRTGRYPQALVDLNKAVSANSEAFFHRGMVHKAIGDIRASIDDFTQAIEHGVNAVESLFNRAVCYMTAESYESAISDFTEYLQSNPDDAEAFTYRGLSYLNLQNYPSAERDLKKAVELESSHPEANYNLCLVYDEQGQYEKALNYCESAIKSGLDDPIVLLTRADIHARLDHVNRAVSDYQTVKSMLEPNHEWVEDIDIKLNRLEKFKSE